MEHIYLIHEREFITTNKNIYKIGRSTNISNRMMNYPKGSNILLILHVSNCTSIENIIKKEFNDKYILRKEYGLEYFEGNKDDMITNIFTINSNYMSLCNIKNVKSLPSNTKPIISPNIPSNTQANTIPNTQSNTIPNTQANTMPIISPNMLSNTQSFLPAITKLDNINLLDSYFKGGLLYNTK